MGVTYIVTGAAGQPRRHNRAACSRRPDRKCAPFRWPGKRSAARRGVSWYTGDVRRTESLRALFSGLDGRDVYVIHAAGVVDISGEMSARMRDVNVEGTKNIIAFCREFSVKRLVYVSSVHAIPEREDMGVMREIRAFSPDAVTGGYAKTKAEATQAVLDAAATGLDAVVVHPSGILGPMTTRATIWCRCCATICTASCLPACAAAMIWWTCATWPLGLHTRGAAWTQRRVLHPLQPPL